ncbi:spore germination protein [Priestia megaterium]|uniref:spore germination protein n=1 Tax=Priestia megaterium TaxID=1404 RepID=UPI0007623695|nr:spore germination protein [Priestia megaterium]KWU58080.1 spore gernimation protein KA [Priestia megaterium]
MRIKKLSELTNKSKQRKEKADESKDSKDTKDTSASSTQEEQKLSERAGDNLSRMKKALGQSTDLVVREFRISIEEKFTLGVAYIDGLVNKDEVEHYALDSIMHYHDEHLTHDDGIVNMYELIKSYSLAAGEIMEAKTLDDALLHVLSGDTVLFLEGYQTCIVASTRGWRDRAVSEPQSQTVVRGPRDSFTETLRTNTALIRRRIKSPKLWIESQQIGEFTKTDIGLVYIDGIADEQVIQEVKERLSKIDIDGILESGYIEELIQDEDYTPFPTMHNTERPDSVAAGLLEGRIAILVDGTPFVLMVPALFIQFFQAAEDYYQRADISTLIRLMRYMAFFLALLTPSAYIALTTFHQEMLPFALLISIAAQREGVPFPAIIEAFIMEITFEILREAGVRLPRAVGSAISIVGALVLGEAAVQAGLVSPAMVIVVSITAISNFVSPVYDMAIAVRMLRFILMVLAATFGLFGIILGLILMILHLCSLRSFGVPYMTPMAPFVKRDQKDVLIRRSIKKMKTRPKLINEKNISRQKTQKN